MTLTHVPKTTTRTSGFGPLARLKIYRAAAGCAQDPIYPPCLPRYTARATRRNARTRCEEEITAHAAIWNRCCETSGRVALLTRLHMAFMRSNVRRGAMAGWSQ